MIMPLSHTDIAHCAMLINQELDSIRVKKHSDFRTVSENLEKILANETGTEHNFDSDFKESMESILAYFSDSNLQELQYTRPEDFPKFKDIVRARIRQKINDFNSYSPAQKFEYVQNQQLRSDKGASDKKVIDAADADGTKRAEHARHIETEEQVLQRIFGDLTFNILEQFHTTPALNDWLVTIAGNIHAAREHGSPTAEEWRETQRSVVVAIDRMLSADGIEPIVSPQ